MGVSAKSDPNWDVSFYHYFLSLLWLKNSTFIVLSRQKWRQIVSATLVETRDKESFLHTAVPYTERKEQGCVAAKQENKKENQSLH